MSKKREAIKTTIQEAIDYWIEFVDECDLSVDWSEADTHCWRCGCEKHLQRCHIIPDSLEGEDCPENIVLLCERCHAEGPNVTDPEIMWDWIKAYKVPFYGTFWSIRGMKEYEFIYKRKVSEELKYILTQIGIEQNSDKFQEEWKTCMDFVMNEASIHFGQQYFNTVTMAGMYRMMLKRFAAEHNVEFPMSKQDETPKTPWWFNV